MKALALLLLPVAAAGADTAFFEAKIRPVLVRHCYECHSAESGKAKGGLRLDSRDDLRRGGDTGPAVVPGQPGQSLLLTAIRHADPDLEMPPDEARLPDNIIADFTRWIREGAADPRDTVAKTTERPPVDLNSARQFWAYQKPVTHAGGIDDFIRTKLREKDLTPAPRAEPRVLLRRLHFDLIGLPPSEMADIADNSDYEKLVDQLLQSPRFGERWGRHWLDVARYAESNGRESNLTFPHAWRYRDYVIDAFNADLPFDRFLTEQIAGDLLPARDAAERARLLIATGFLALGPKGLNEQNKAQFAADVADEQIDAVTRAVLASSVACARCHDHKTEPFTMEDYYALAGIFKSTQTFYGNWIDSENNNHGHLIRLPERPDQIVVGKSLPEARVRQLKADLAKLNAEEKAQEEYIAKAKAEGRDLGPEFNKLLGNSLRILWTRGGVEGALEAVDDQGRARPLCMGAQDGEARDSPLFERGELARPGATVPRGFPRVFGIDLPVPKERSGRLQLAQWLTHRDHPLTARVLVNRVWRHLFGAGLVRTIDTFGFSGERPSHPELLDTLAVRFMEGGWSVKKLIREIVLSETYRQASRTDFHPPSAHRTPQSQDPDNRLLAHANRRRLDAEVLRDAMLAVSGRLDLSRRPGSLVAELDGQSVSLIGFNAKLPPDLDGSQRRSVYLPVIRDHLPDVLEQFDVANPNLVTGDREVTNVPLQALYLLNGPFVQAAAEALAARVSEGDPERGEQVHRAFVLCFNRPPNANEQQLAKTFFASAPGEPAAQLTALCQALLASAEFRLAD
jgi:hypothetical protein